MCIFSNINATTSNYIIKLVPASPPRKLCCLTFSYFISFILISSDRLMIDNCIAWCSMENDTLQYDMILLGEGEQQRKTISKRRSIQWHSVYVCIIMLLLVQAAPRCNMFISTRNWSSINTPILDLGGVHYKHMHK